MKPINQGGMGRPKQDDPSRVVDRHSNAVAVAAKLHYDKGMNADQVRQMGAEELSAVSGKADLDPYETSQVMRAYEHYK
jgi:hypothetical protein